MSDVPTSREQLAQQIGTYRSTLFWIENQLFIWIDDASNYANHCFLDDYLIWLFRQATAPKYRMKGRSSTNPKNFRLNRQRLLDDLNQHPEQFSYKTFTQSLKGSNEQTRIVDFNPAYRCRIRSAVAENGTN